MVAQEQRGKRAHLWNPDRARGSLASPEFLRARPSASKMDKLFSSSENVISVDVVGSSCLGPASGCASAVYSSRKVTNFRPYQLRGLDGKWPRHLGETRFWETITF